MTTNLPIIAIDKDDTLNWLTYSIMQASGVENPSPESIPEFSDIKKAAGLAKVGIPSKKVSKDFLKAREKCFADPNFFASPPYGLAKTLVSMASEYGFEPTICTKTMTNHPKFAEITAAKMRFWQEHFPDTDMMIATGKKSIDAIALIDDLMKNGLDFNTSNYRPFLVWNHKTGTVDTIRNFYSYCQFYNSFLNEKPTQLTTKSLVLSEKDGQLMALYVENEDAQSYDSVGNFVSGFEDSSFEVTAFYVSKKAVKGSVPFEDILLMDELKSLVKFNIKK